MSTSALTVPKTLRLPAFCRVMALILMIAAVLFVFTNACDTGDDDDDGPTGDGGDDDDDNNDDDDDNDDNNDDDNDDDDDDDDNDNDDDNNDDELNNDLIITNNPDALPECGPVQTLYCSCFDQYIDLIDEAVAQGFSMPGLADPEIQEYFSTNPTPYDLPAISGQLLSALRDGTNIKWLVQDIRQNPIEVTETGFQTELDPLV